MERCGEPAIAATEVDHHGTLHRLQQGGQVPKGLLALGGEAVVLARVPSRRRPCHDDLSVGELAPSADAGFPGVGVGGHLGDGGGELSPDHVVEGHTFEHSAQAGPHRHPHLLEMLGSTLVRGHLGA